MKKLKRQLPFLRSILKQANQNVRKDLIRHANKDQINAVSEMTLNFLKNNIPVSPVTMARLRPYRDKLRKLGSRSLSLKKRRRILENQRGGAFWKGLDTVLQCCCR